MPYLTKSRYVQGLRCPRSLWLGVHAPEPYVEAEPFSAIDNGNRIGSGAHNLFPGGVEVLAGPGEQAEAVRHTRELMADENVPAIFEAAIEYDGIYVRVDILERLADGTWGLREVKAAANYDPNKKYHLDDVAVQLYVLLGYGLEITSAELIHVDTGYIYQGGDVDWKKLLHRENITKAALARQDTIRANLPAFMVVLDQAEMPAAEPTKTLCQKPYPCAFWERCTQDKPDDWVAALPGIRETQLLDWAAQSIVSITGIPNGTKMSDTYARIRNVVNLVEPLVSNGLHPALNNFGPPAYYLDFETTSPVIPIYPGTHAYENKFAFQWSVHHLDAANQLHHHEFLAEGDVDPRPEAARTLVEALSNSNAPIVVYSQKMEEGTLKKLAEAVPKLEKPLLALLPRLRDLQPVIKNNILEPDFFTKASVSRSTYSLKNVLNVMVPHLDYSQLDGVADGLAAGRAFERIVALKEEAAALRQELLEYCKLDTMAMVELHRVLRDRLDGLPLPDAAE